MVEKAKPLAKLTAAQARAVALAAQGLLVPPSKPANKRSVLDQIRRMGALQIDTISVVARSPYLTLWSRLGEYDPDWLNQHLAEGRIFEYWAHAACFLPTEDYPLFRRQMIEPESFHWQYSTPWVSENRQEIDRVLAAIRANGPMRSAEFGSDRPGVTGWWEWKPAKRALEMLFTAGELMIARRDNFHRVYDLRERVLRNYDDAAVPTTGESVSQLAEKVVKALGVTRAEWVADYYRLNKKQTLAAIAELTNSGVLLPVAVEEWVKPGLILIHRDHLKMIRRVLAGKLEPTVTTLLSPFDPIVWDRARAQVMFDFDYRLECYTPEPKRRYGYFTLPILHRGALVGRLDAKAHRKAGIFEVKVVHLEPKVDPDIELASALADALRKCAAWHRTPLVQIKRTAPVRFLALLRSALKRIK